MPVDPTLLGTVQDVRGPTVSVALTNESFAQVAFIGGVGYRVGQPGSFVRIPLGYLNLFGVVSQVGASAVPERLAHSEPFGYRWMAVELVGEAHRDREFQRGLSQYPTVGDSVFLLIEQDLEWVYGRGEAPNLIRVGSLASAESIPALVDVNRLVTRHCAVVGTTGSGKSTTVAGLLASLSEPGRFPSARVLVFDLHGEYSAALRDRATVYRINPNEARGELPLYIPYWAMTFDELMTITLGQLDDQARGAVLEKISDLKLSSLTLEARNGVTPEDLTVDSPVPFSIHKLWFDLHRLVNATHTQPGTAQGPETEALELDGEDRPVQPGNALRVVPPRYRPQTQAAGASKVWLSASPLNIRRPLEGLASKLRDPRYDFLFRPGPWTPNESGVPDSDLDDLLKDWIGGDRPITILDLSGAPTSVVGDLIGAVLRILYDALFWSRNLSEGGRERPLMVVMEEAHSYLSQSTSPAALAVRRIVKEGRKYGLGAMVVSQRPAEIDPTVLSQCGTLVAMRLTNETDRAQIVGTVADNLTGLLSSLPVLRTGEAIVLGEAVHLPMRALIAPPAKDRQPDSKDPLVYDDNNPGGWNRSRENDDYGEVVELWRSQTSAPRKVTMGG